MRERFTITTRRGLGEFDPLEWNALAAAAGFYSSYEWLSVWEQHNDTVPEVITITGGGRLGPPNRLLAAAPCYLIEPGMGNPRYDLSHLLARDTGPHCGAVPGGHLGGAVPSWGAQLTVGSPAGYAGGVLVDPALDRAARREALAALWSGITILGADSEAETITVPYLDRGAALEIREVVRSAGADPLAVLTDMRAEVPLPLAVRQRGVRDADTQHYEDYLHGLGRKCRERIRSDLRRMQLSGYTVDVVPAVDQIPVMAPLLGMVQARHGHNGDPEAAASYLRLCTSGPLAEQALCFRAQRDSRTAAFALAYPFANRLHIRVVGMDYEQARRHGLYFTVLIHEPVRYALACGLDTVELGMESLSGKLGKGGHPVELWTIAVSTRPELNSAARRRTSWLLGYWREQLAVEVDGNLCPEDA